MTEFTVSSDNLSLVSPINSEVDRVFEIKGETFFTTASHPSVGIQVKDVESVKDVLVQGASINIYPVDGSSDQYLIKVSPKVVKTKKASTKSASPTRGAILKYFSIID